MSSAAIVLELAESLAGRLTDGVEGLELETKRGTWAEVRADGDPAT